MDQLRNITRVKTPEPSSINGKASGKANGANGFPNPPAVPSTLNPLETIGKKVNEASSLLNTILRPPPTSLDGRSNFQRPGGNIIPKAPGFIDDFFSQADRLHQDAGLVNELIKTKMNDGLQNDKNYLTEKIIQLAVSLPDGSDNQSKLTGGLIGQLWDTMQHPPLTYLGDAYKYRTADGSYNNIMYPNIGKSGTPYARSVPPRTVMDGVAPDPGLIFDSLLARNGDFKPHPTNISSMLFYFATIIIHDIFSTSHTDPNISNSSSYLDLGPVYGNNQAEQDSVRAFHDGFLKPDTFAASRILGFPPGVAAMLVCFSRFHNYVANELAVINEAGRFNVPVLDTTIENNEEFPNAVEKEQERYDAAVKKRDNDLFQTARLVTCGLYINIVLVDYVRTILNLNRVDTQWSLDPRKEFGAVFNMEGTPVGIGNQVSVEFNLIYRWHCAVSEKDEKWVSGFMEEIFPGRDPETLTTQELKEGLARFGHSLPRDPAKWEFGGIKRNEATGKFNDEELARIIQEATEDVAGSYGAKNIPNALKVVELLGIEQSRAWKVASLNEFRKFFGLQPHKTFTDINPDPDVAKTLEVLYDHPDLVEMYPGILAESAKIPMVPGSGLCPGFTISRAILSDAVTLVRGDRFYTLDYNPAVLTNWGFTEVASNPKVANGGVINKLLQRALPGYYRGNSVYALFPFNTPAENKRIHTSLGTVESFDYSPPKFIGPPTPIHTHKACLEILGDQERFKVPWGKNTYELTKHDYMLSGDTPWHAQQREKVVNALYSPQDAMKEIRLFYENVTKNLILQKAYKLGKVYQADAVRDIGNMSHANFVANLFHIPLKTTDHPLGIFTESEVYQIYSIIFAYVFLDLDAANSVALKTAAKEAVEPMAKVLAGVIHTLRATDFLSPIKDLFNANHTGILRSYGAKLIQRLSADKQSVDETVWEIIPTAAGAVCTQAQGFAQMLDLYLSPQYEHHWPEIQRLARSTDPEDFEVLKKYALEGYRLATPAFGLIRVTAEETTIVDGSHTHNFQPGSTVFTDFVSACVDPAVFPDPYEVKLDRDESLYIHHGYGPHSCIGRNIVVTSMAAQLKVFGKLRGLRRVKGGRGEMKSKTINGAFKVYMKEDWTGWWPFPTGLRVEWDAFEEEF